MRRALVASGVIGLSMLHVLCGCATSSLTAEQTEELEKIATEQRSGRLVFSGQPSKLDLAWYKEQGFETVINTRSTRETSDRDRIGYDQKAEAMKLGLRYIEIPTGGGEGYEPAMVEAFLAALEEAERATAGDILVHCGSGGRARYLWGAALVRRDGLSVDEAQERMRGVGHNDGIMERLLGERLSQQPAGPLPVEEDEDEG